MDDRVRTLCAQPDAAHALEQFDTIAGMISRQHPKGEAMMPAANEDLLAFTGFTVGHWK